MKISKATLVLGALFALAACSAKIDGGANPPPADNFVDKVRGPSIEGTWTSLCVADMWEPGKSTIYSFTYQGREVSRAQKKFEDAECTRELASTEGKGSFRFVGSRNERVYEVEYKLDYRDGVIRYQGEMIRIEGDTLYISDRVVGEVEPHIALYKQKSETLPTPIQEDPTPTPEPGDCVDYSGRYEINGRYFKFTQLECKEIVHEIEATYSNPNPPPPLRMIADGQVRAIQGLMMKIYFKDRLFRREYTNNGSSVVETWSFSKQPCNLMNPNGEDYLMMDALIDGTSHECQFWARQR